MCKGVCVWCPVMTWCIIQSVFLPHTQSFQERLSTNQNKVHTEDSIRFDCIRCISVVELFRHLFVTTGLRNNPPTKTIQPLWSITNNNDG